jgi:hypothetical protein
MTVLGTDSQTVIATSGSGADMEPSLCPFEMRTAGSPLVHFVKMEMLNPRNTHSITVVPQKHVRSVGFFGATRSSLFTIDQTVAARGDFDSNSCVGLRSNCSNLFSPVVRIL